MFRWPHNVRIDATQNQARMESSTLMCAFNLLIAPGFVYTSSSNSRSSTRITSCSSCSSEVPPGSYHVSILARWVRKKDAYSSLPGSTTTVCGFLFVTFFLYSYGFF